MNTAKSRTVDQLTDREQQVAEEAAEDLATLMAGFSPLSWSATPEQWGEFKSERYRLFARMHPELNNADFTKLYRREFKNDRF